MRPLDRERDVATYVEPHVQGPREDRATPGHRAIVLMLVALGGLLLGLQLWLLSAVHDLFLAGEGRFLWAAFLISGLIFLGGVAALRVLGRQEEREGR